jgi:endonuclease/exonuclease/phosphatase family metal-dependent hydrolase
MAAELTVASLNVHWGRGTKGAGYPEFDVTAVCKRLDADVIALQESWAPDDGESQHDAAARELGYEVVSVPLSRADAWPEPRITDRHDPERRSGSGDWCLAVLTRLPVLATRTHRIWQLPVDPSSRAVLHLDLDVDGAPLTFCSTHFTHLEFGAVLHTRALRGSLPPVDRPAVLMGDMNMWGWCISAMTPRGWRRVGRGRTWPAHRPHSRIDHLLVTPSVEVLDTETFPDVGSDHRPIRARLRLR